MFFPRPPLRFSPLSLLSVYLRQEFLRLFFFSLVLFLFLALLVDFFDRLDYLIKYKSSVSTVLLYFLFKTPLFITQAAPVAALTAALMSLGSLSRNREITALKACGVSQWQIARPLLLAAGILTVALWGWNETVVPQAYRQSRYINLKIKKRLPKSVFHENGFWYHGNNSFYHIEHFDSRENILSGITIYVIDEHFRVLSLIESSQASWRDGQWQFKDFQEKSLALDGAPASARPVPILEETPEDFTLADIEPEEFSSHQLRNYITDLQEKGVDATAYQVDLRLKGAMPFAIFAMTLLGLALAVPGARQLPLATAVGFALVVGFGYWLLLALTVSLGHSGAIPPLLAAWAANGVGVLLGIFFLLGID